MHWKLIDQKQLFVIYRLLDNNYRASSFFANVSVAVLQPALLTGCFQVMNYCDSPTTITRMEAAAIIFSSAGCALSVFYRENTRLIILFFYLREIIPTIRTELKHADVGTCMFPV